MHSIPLSARVLVGLSFWVLVGLLVACSRSEPEAAGQFPPPPTPEPDPESASWPAQPDVLIVTIDTLRHDFLSCYGFPNQTTPAIDALAEDGTLFEQHRTVISLTLPAHASLFSGLHPAEHGSRRNSHVVDPAVPLLAERLRAAGYRTSAFVGSTVLALRRGLARGFETYDDEMPSNARRIGAKKEDFECDAGAVFLRALAAVKSEDPRPLFLWIHLFDPHEPYNAPQEAEQASEASRAIHVAAVEPSEIVSAERQLKHRLGYEAEVRHVDTMLGKFLAHWDARPRGRSALVVVTADHGQGLGEHDYCGHGFRVYEEQLRVPLVLRMRGRVPAGMRVGAQTSSVDVASTVLDLARVADASGFGGASLAPLLAGGSSATSATYAERREWLETDVQRVGEVRTLLEMLAGRAGATRGDQYALVDGRWKYIWSADVLHELFDLESDPREADNLIERHREDAEALRARLEQWHDSVRLRAADPPISDEDDETQRALRALGY